MSSTRLPGKMLKPILGRPMLARQLERLARMRLVGCLVVATSDMRDDNEIEALCGDLGVTCYRGALDDVLDRVYLAAKNHSPEHVVRLTGDCPLADPALIDALIAFHCEGGYDYSSNTLTPTWPDGLDAEVCRFSALESAWQEAQGAAVREHVTPFLYNHPERFRMGDFRNSVDLSSLRWTVDEPEDFDFVERVYQALYPGNPSFTTDDILALLDYNPDLSAINNRFRRNEGYKRVR